MAYQTIVNADFETRSTIDLKKCGAYKYAMSYTTEVMLLSWRYDRSLYTTQVRTWFFKEPLKNISMLKTLAISIARGEVEFHGHNVEFEYAIWNYCFRRQILHLTGINLPKLKISQLRCTAARAAVLTYPRHLENLCQVLDTSVKKDGAGKKVMLKLSKPRKPTKDNPSIWHEDLEDLKTLINYNIDDVKTEVACGKKLPPLTPIELRLFHLTIEMNETGVGVDLPLVKTAHEFVGQFNIEKQAELMTLTNGRVKTGKQVQKLKVEIENAGFSIDNLQADTVEAALKISGLSRKAKRLLEIRRLLSKSSVSKLKTILDSVNKDGRVRGCQMYYGASTGRWAGRGMQPHNFVRSVSPLIPSIIEGLKFGDYTLFRDAFGDVHTAVSQVLRSLIVPQKDHSFFDVDWSAIEARIILWLAGDKRGLQIYHKGGDPYKKLASVIFDKNILDITKDERHIGKQGTLGSGFGMGHEKMALQYDMDPVLAHKTIKTWRKMHKETCAFWRELQKTACEAVENPGKVFAAGQHIWFVMRNKRLLCFLPSGRPLYYLKPRVSETFKRIKIRTPYYDGGKLRYEIELKTIRQVVVTHTTFKGSYEFRRAIHGGVLAENVAQGTARDIMASAMLWLKNAKYKQTLSVHDEILCEEAKIASFDMFKKLTEQKPSWARTLPLKTNYWNHNRYGSY